MRVFLAFALFVGAASSAPAQTPPRVAASPHVPARRAAPPSLAGIYQSIPDTQVLPGGLKNSGGPLNVTLQPPAITEQAKVDLKADAAKLCLPVGPFRMMARDRVKIELVPGPNLLVMIYEDVSHGHLRNIHFNRQHPATVPLSWLGDSIGRWAEDTLVVDTVGFNDRTWLNEMGAPHSDALHLIERIRPLGGGTILEYKVTADDPMTLTAPYTYVRYYTKTPEERGEDFCEAEFE